MKMKGGDEFTGCGEIEGKARQLLRSPDIQKEVVVGAVLKQRLTPGARQYSSGRTLVGCLFLRGYQEPFSSKY